MIIECPRWARVFVGDALEIMRGMPDNSVDCICTSPPYWGLRDYGIEPSIFSANPRCDHEWGPALRITGPGKGAQGKTSARSGRQNTTAQETHRTAGQFCRWCGAWRGQLGLEPTLGLFLEHMVEVFEEMRRLLKPSGVLWLNIGDTYASAVNGRTASATKAAGNDDRTYRDKPFSTVGPIFAPDATQASRRGRSGNLGNGGKSAATGALGRVIAGGTLKPKDRIMIPARLAIALQEAGWYLRDEIVWAKRNPMPSSTEDRTTPAHEMVYLLTKSERYFYDCDAIREPFADGRMGADYPRPNSPGTIKSPYGQGFTRAARSERARGGRDDGYTTPSHIDPSAHGGRNKRSVWTISTEPAKNGHFATFPTALVEPMIKAGTSEAGCCELCGAPWQRLTLRKFVPQPDVSIEKGARTGMDDMTRWEASQRGSTKVVTLGWYPACRCRGLPRLPRPPAPTRLIEPAPLPEGTGKREKARHATALRAWQDEQASHAEKLADYDAKITAAAAGAAQFTSGLSRSIVMDPFGGTGTVGVVAQRLARASIIIDRSEDYAEIAVKRLRMEWAGPDERERIRLEDAQVGPGDLPLFSALGEELLEEGEDEDAGGDEPRDKLAGANSEP